MRLVQLADYAGPYPGSFVPMLRAAFAEARERGWDVAAVLPAAAVERPWLAELERDGVPVRLVPAATQAQARAAAEAALDGAGPVIAHTHFGAFDVGAARALRGRRDAALVWHIHGRLATDPATRLRNTARFVAFARRVDDILCVSPDLVRNVRTRLAPPARVHFFPNAIDTARFAPAGPEARAAARARIGLPAERRVALHFGWDWERKGGDLMLEAAARAGRGDVTFATVGGGAAARAAVAAADLRGADVRVLEPVADVAALYAAADVFLSPSRSEGMPFAVAEALASGLGVVASAVPGQVWVGRTVDACRLVALDPGAIAGALGALLDRPPDVAAREGRDAAAHIAATMDLRPWARRLAERYERLLSAGR